jgi:lysophospholipase L1-like esterase
VLELLARAVEPHTRIFPGELFEHADSTVVGHEQLAYYRTRPWGPEYWRELQSLGTHYMPFTIWRRAPFHGRQIVVDDSGYRRTPGADCRPGAFTVFAIGGSTLWGYGAPDWGTIPAYLQAELARVTQGPVCVRNLGEFGYTSTQDLIELERHLERGDVPDVVIALQGANDLWSAYQNGRPGLHFYIEEIAWKLERGTGESPTAQLLRRLALVRLLAPAETHREVRGWQSTDTVLADRSVAIYRQNYRMLQALAREYGFECRVFWQPNLLVSPKSLTDEERAIREGELRREGPVWLYMLERGHADAAAFAPADGHFYDLNEVFRDRPELVWADWAHVTPEANQLLARRMLETLPLGPVVSRSRSGPVSAR